MLYLPRGRLRPYPKLHLELATAGRQHFVNLLSRFAGHVGVEGTKGRRDYVESKDDTEKKKLRDNRKQHFRGAMTLSKRIGCRNAALQVLLQKRCQAVRSH